MHFGLCTICGIEVIGCAFHTKKMYRVDQIVVFKGSDIIDYCGETGLSVGALLFDTGRWITSQSS